MVNKCQDLLYAVSHVFVLIVVATVGIIVADISYFGRCSFSFINLNN